MSFIGSVLTIYKLCSRSWMQVLDSSCGSGNNYEHITATLCVDLHWLPIRQRITSKLCTIVYRCLHGATPSYLTEMCVPFAANTGRCCLHSAARGDLMVPRTRTITYGSPTLHSSSITLGQFQYRLKTTQFRSTCGCDLALSWLFRPLELAPNLLTYYWSIRWHQVPG